MNSTASDHLHNLRHTAAHLLAHAVLNLFGDKVKFGIGPVIEHGFYYDFEFPKPVGQADLPKIEAEMKKIIKQNPAMTREEYSFAEARKLMKNQPYKLTLLNEIKKGERAKVKEMKKGKTSFYRLGNFLDLCKGGHLKRAGDIPPDGFRLLTTAGAYWKGSEKNPMLTRIYALAFETKKDLDEHLRLLAEAARRDHKILGPKLELFTFHETAPGMPYWLPKGVAVINELVNFWRKEHVARGYEEIVSPLLNKKELYVTSGHYEHYWENMFVSKTAEGEEYGVKAMNCPNAMVVFGLKPRSYKDLPLRLADTDTLHRFELSGTLNGLLRVREFRQDDAHIFVTEEQIGEEYGRVLEIVERFYSVFNLPYSYRLGTRPENFLGDKKTWDRAEEVLKKILQKSRTKFTIAEKDGAFYGPKVDILINDALGRQWQMGTIQLDFQQPRRFGLEYAASDSSKKTPVAIHRVIYGSLERFIGILIEHFVGALPLWLAPVQAVVLPLSDQFNGYAEKVIAESRLKIENLRIAIDRRNESIGKKIREAEMQKIPYMLIVGNKEKTSGTVSVRQRGQKNLGAMKLKKFVEKIQKEIEDKDIENSLKIVN